MKFLLFLTLFSTAVLALKLPDTLQAKFTQTVTNEHNQTLTYKGKIYYKAPQSSKWIYTSPTDKAICVDNSNITIVEHDLEQVSVYQNRNYIDFTQLYADARKLDNTRYITYFQDKKYFLTLKEQKLHTLSFTDELNNHSKIEFSQVVYDKPLPPLHCKTPEDYDLILQ